MYTTYKPFLTSIRNPNNTISQTFPFMLYNLLSPQEHDFIRETILHRNIESTDFQEGRCSGHPSRGGRGRPFTSYGAGGTSGGWETFVRQFAALTHITTVVHCTKPVLSAVHTLCENRFYECVSDSSVSLELLQFVSILKVLVEMRGSVQRSSQDSSLAVSWHIFRRYSQ